MAKKRGALKTRLIVPTVPFETRDGRNGSSLLYQLFATLENNSHDKLLQVVSEWLREKFTHSVPEDYLTRDGFLAEQDVHSLAVHRRSVAHWCFRYTLRERAQDGSVYAWLLDFGTNSRQIGVKLTFEFSAHKPPALKFLRPKLVDSLVKKVGLRDVKPLTDETIVLTSSQAVNSLYDLVQDEERYLPVVLISTPKFLGVPQTAKTEASASTQLIGLAHVAYLSRNQRLQWTKLIGKDNALSDEGMRVYLPTPKPQPQLQLPKASVWMEAMLPALRKSLFKFSSARTVEWGELSFLTEAKAGINGPIPGTGPPAEGQQGPTDENKASTSRSDSAHSISGTEPAPNDLAESAPWNLFSWGLVPSVGLLIPVDRRHGVNDVESFIGKSRKALAAALLNFARRRGRAPFWLLRLGQYWISSQIGSRREKMGTELLRRILAESDKNGTSDLESAVREYDALLDRQETLQSPHNNSKLSQTETWQSLTSELSEALAKLYLKKEAGLKEFSKITRVLRSKFAPRSALFGNFCEGTLLKTQELVETNHEHAPAILALVLGIAAPILRGDPGGWLLAHNCELLLSNFLKNSPDCMTRRPITLKPDENVDWPGKDPTVNSRLSDGPAKSMLVSKFYPLVVDEKASKTGESFASTTIIQNSSPEPSQAAMPGHLERIEKSSSVSQASEPDESQSSIPDLKRELEFLKKEIEAKRLELEQPLSEYHQEVFEMIAELQTYLPKNLANLHDQVERAEVLLNKLPQFASTTPDELTECPENWSGGSLQFCTLRLPAHAETWSKRVSTKTWRELHATLLSCRIIHVSYIHLLRTYADAMGAPFCRLTVLPVEVDWIAFIDVWDAGLGAAWRWAIAEPMRLHLVALQGLEVSVTTSWLRPVLNLHAGMSSTLRPDFPFEWPDNLRLIWQTETWPKHSVPDPQLLRATACVPLLTDPNSERPAPQDAALVHYATWRSWAVEERGGRSEAISAEQAVVLGDAAKRTAVETANLKATLVGLGILPQAAQRLASDLRLGLALGLT